MVEWVKYTAYCIPFGMPLADTNSDGLLNSTDVTAITNWTSGYDVRYDPNLDGAIDSSDISIATNAADITMGFGALSDVGNRKVYIKVEKHSLCQGCAKSVCKSFIYKVSHQILNPARLPIPPLRPRLVPRLNG